MITMSGVLSGLSMCAVGFGLVYAYAAFARRKLGVKLDLVQVCMYRVKMDGRPISLRAVENVLGILKFVGLIFLVGGVVAAFSGM